MIVVHGFGPYFGLPEASPFVLKTMLHLKLAGQDYAHSASGTARAPHGKVPYLEDDGEVVSDSGLIRTHIERKYGVDLDSPLTPEQRAVAWSVEKMAEGHLYFALVDMRWRDERNFASGPAHFFDKIPGLARPVIRRIGRRRMLETLYLQGTSRLSREDVDQETGRDIEAISTLLGHKPFLMGEVPTAVDGFVYGILANLLVPVFESRLRERIERHPNLMSYVDRVSRSFFPASNQASGHAISGAG